MPATPLDSVLYRDLLGDAELAALFSDTAEIRAMMLVLGALAQAQAQEAVIPKKSAEAIHRAGLEIVIDPGALTERTGQNAVPIPGLVTEFRHEMQAPEHAQYLHWGATSQDIMDTALMLRLRQVIAIFEARLLDTIRSLGAAAATYADLPMAARTYGQFATPTSFGAVVASWGQPLLRHRRRLGPVKDDLLCVSLSGASGTLSAMGDKGAAVRAALAEGLGLGDPGQSWHSTRDSVGAFSGWMCGLAGSLGKIGQDLILMTQSGIEEVVLSGGASSTMPQKSNPVAPSVLVAAARQAVALNTAMQSALVHGQQRDGTAWITEWLSLPQICCLTARALANAGDLAKQMSPNADAMARNLARDKGLINAEALTFALAAHISRPEAQELVKSMVLRAKSENRPLVEIARIETDIDLAGVFDPAVQIGNAPAEARSFAAAASGA